MTLAKLAYAVATDNQTGENLIDAGVKADFQLSKEELTTIFSKETQVKLSDLLVMARSWMSSPV